MANDSYVFPLSYAQQRLWFLDQLIPQNPFYNICIAHRITSHLDAGRLEKSLNQIIERHEILRTSFSADDGQPVQIVAPHLELPLEINDLTRLDHGKRQAEAERLAAAEAAQPFDLARAPLLRATLLRLAPYDHVLLLTMHHIISDGWSLGVLWRELGEFYSASLNGHSPALPPLPVQYADYAVWQREYLSGDVLERQLQYWEQQLRDVPPLELPTDNPRPPVPSFRGAYHHFSLPKPLADSLAKFSRRENVTLFMTLLAVFKTLLSRWSRLDDIVVGTPIANRDRAETENLIGFFANTLVLRSKLSDAVNFRSLVHNIREVTIGAYDHQDLPFEMLVDRLHGERDIRRNPLFQVTFQLFNGANAANASGRNDPALEIKRGTSIFDLAFKLAEDIDGLKGEIEYSTDLFTRKTIERLADQFAVLAESAVTSPEKLLSTLPVLTSRERRQLLVEWNRTHVDRTGNDCLHQLFEKQAASTPDAPALISEAETLTYTELNERANRLAHFLRDLGVGRETPVAVCMQRSSEVVVALLAILKAGGAYVPIDPAYPPGRIAFMLDDSAVLIMLTQSDLIPSLPERSGRTICLDTICADISTYSARNPVPISKDDNLAYVIYTSGSTGNPKGAMLQHRGVVNCLSWMQDTYRLNSEDRFLFRTSLNFDPSVWEIFWPLMVGAAIVVAPPEHGFDSSVLINTVRDKAVTVIYLVPSVLRVLLDDAGVAALRTLRYVISGGESLPVETVKTFSALLNAELHHSYGPTEASIAATEWRCPAGPVEKVLIGRPLANTQLYLLDESLEPVPIGVTGELFLGGVGLARGYLNRSELTAAAFVPHPFSSEPGARLYRTGDLVRYRADGQLEFIGRKDQQVKIRGYRIEPGEVEAVLRRHESIGEVVVSARGDGDGNKQLAAYVVAAAGQEVDPAVLRAHLLDHLPAYMIPSSFMQLEQLPLTVGGKIDQRRLPDPDHTGIKPEYCAPRTDVERVLAQIWAEVLGLEEVGVTDSFFDLGGHSLLATQLISRVRDSLLIELPLRMIFDTPTVAGLAEKVLAQAQERSKIEKTASILLSLERLSENEVETLLQQKADAR